MAAGTSTAGCRTMELPLTRLLEQGFIEEVCGDRDADSRRRYYRLMRGGRALMHSELERVEALLEKAKARSRRG
jgi:DNA-binding PadR family transcriptional regulator